MKLKQLLEQLNQLAKERPQVLEMEALLYDGNQGKSEIVEEIVEELGKVFLVFNK